mgnify:FL=1|jgi:hypothetical protein
MITVKRIRKAPAYVTTCPVCHTRIAPQGANVRVVIDAESEATAISAITHAACARVVIDFTRERGYAPAELAEVGAWIEVER